uniref:Uncharacterized protein n=1 Tax=Crocodylus porosus TaxID=8502 RepID=A0A7M4E864_CROPO
CSLRPVQKVSPDLHDQKFCETVPKELCCQQLNTHFGFNLWCHVHVITRKPVSGHGNMEEPVDPKDLNLIHHAAIGSPAPLLPKLHCNHLRVPLASHLLPLQLWGFCTPTALAGSEGCGAEQTHLLFIGRKRWRWK